MDRHLTALKHCDALRHNIAADDVMTELGETGCSHEPHVADADHPDGLACAHRVTGLKLFAIAIMAEFGMRPVNEFSSQ